jgi:hypothetical protein
VSQVIYRRAWCPNCQRETVNRVQSTYVDEVMTQEEVTCTECQGARGSDPR